MKTANPTYALDGNERRTLLVVGLTAVTMVLELTVGWWTGSMALWADGFHMASHAGALGVTLVGYRYARKHGTSEAFAFGTGKVFSLAGFASAVALTLVAIQMMGESLYRLIAPVPIAYDKALPVAVLGLVVNLVSAWLLHRDEAVEHGHGHHHHSHGRGHDHEHGHHDHNLRAAFLHVVADAVTSVGAILALIGGTLFGLAFLDPLLGIAGSILVAHWGLGLIRESSRVLLDRSRVTLQGRIVEELQAAGLQVSDLRVWQLGPGTDAALLEVVDGESPRRARVALKGFPSLKLVQVMVRPRETIASAGTKAENVTV
ncbi:MAG: CDF family Co(II)/Ni(II) efflux transporter DmeF [Myxococcota bacterium]